MNDENNDQTLPHFLYLFSYSALTTNEIIPIVDTLGADWAADLVGVTGLSKADVIRTIAQRCIGARVHYQHAALAGDKAR